MTPKPHPAFAELRRAHRFPFSDRCLKRNRGARAYLPILWSHCHNWPLQPTHCNLGAGGRPRETPLPRGPAGDGCVGGGASENQSRREGLLPPAALLAHAWTAPRRLRPTNHRVPRAGWAAGSRGHSVPRFRQRLAARGAAAAAYAVSMGTEDGAARWGSGGVWVAGPDPFSPLSPFYPAAQPKPSIFGC